MISTINTIIISLIIGVVIGILSTLLIRKLLRKTNSDNSDFSSILNDLAQLLQMLCLEKSAPNSQYSKNWKVIPEIYDLLEEISIKLDDGARMRTDVHSSIQNSRENSVSKKLPRTSRNQSANQPQTAAPIPEEPTPQRQQPQPEVASQLEALKMGKVFEEVIRLQEEKAPIYRDYNEQMKKLVYTTSSSADYIVKENGNEMFVLPNQSTSFHPKYISNALYQCSISYINSDCIMKTMCKANKYGEIIQIGEIV